LMGLAPYGEPKYVGKILSEIIDIKPDGSFRLNQHYFNYCTGLTMTNRRFDELFGRPARTPDQRLTQFHMDVAASIQAVTEEVVLRLCRSLRREYGMQNLCLAGGVALNCVANGKIWKEGIFDRIWVQPAAGDAGGALGAALSTYYGDFERPRIVANGLDGMAGSYLGPAFVQSDIEARRGGDRGYGDRANGREGDRVDAGAHGVRATCARGALDPRRSAQSDHAKDAQPSHQVS
jgi:carbamoyltransferase